MSWVALIFLPLILAYQGFTYWIFRKRVTRAHIPVEAAH
jgi:cytochrome d ubiquinol oxidase subunit II